MSESAASEVIRCPILERSLDVDEASFEVRQDGDGTVRLKFSASSEYPVQRYFGNEVLDHGAGAVRLDRAERGAVPLLFNHNMDDPVGMVDSARVNARRLEVDAHLFDTDRAEVMRKMIAGGLRNISVRYKIHTAEERDNGDVFISDWEVLETSVVTIPADPTVGVGRSAPEGVPLYEVRMSRPSTPADTATNRQEETEMSDHDDTATAGDTADKQETRERSEDRSKDRNEDRRDDRRNERGDDRDNRDDDRRAEVRDRPGAKDFEKSRIRGIERLCEANKIDERTRQYWINSGLALDEVADDLVGILQSRSEKNPQSQAAIGMSEGDAQLFSLARAIRACEANDWSDAGFELEASRAVAKQLGKVVNSKRFFVPFEVQQRSLSQEQIKAVRHGQRDLTVGTAGAGGHLVETQNMGFIEMVRNRAVAFRMGATRLSGLQGSVTIPRQSAAATPVWLATEASQATESQQTFVQVALSPKTVGAYTEISRQLLLQSSPGVEGIVTDDLALVAALAVDLGVLNGSGAGGEPEGIINATGPGAVTGATLDYADVLEFQTDVAAANVEPMSGGYVTTPAVASIMMQRVKFTGTASPLWEGSIWDGVVAGFPAMSSNQMPAASAIFGDWSQAVVAEWGVLEVEVNPFANFQAGIIGVRALYSVDVGLRRPFAFSVADATIT